MLLLRSLELQLSISFSVQGWPVLLRLGESAPNYQQHVEAGHVRVHLQSDASPSVSASICDKFQGTRAIDGPRDVHDRSIDAMLGHHLDGSHCLMPFLYLRVFRGRGLRSPKSFWREDSVHLIELAENLSCHRVVFWQEPSNPVRAAKELPHVRLFAQRVELHDRLCLFRIRCRAESPDQVPQQDSLRLEDLGLSDSIRESSYDRVVEEGF